MKNNTITNGQLFFLLTLGLFKTLEFPKYMAQTCGISCWILILFTSIIFGIAGAVIAKLNSMYQEEIFFDYSQKITGKFSAYLFAFYYILYYFIFCNYFNQVTIDFITTNFLPKTPQSVMIFSGILILVYISYKGVRNIARLAQLMSWVMIIFILMSIAILVTGERENFLPLLNIKELNFESFKYSIPVFGGLEFILLIPFSKQNKKPAKTVFLIILFVGMIYVTYVEATIITLGVNNTMSLNDSFMEAMRMLDFPLFERMDIFFLIPYFVLTFHTYLLIFTGIIEYVCKIFPKVKRQIISALVGLISFLIFLFTANIKNIEKIYEMLLPFLVIIACILIPAIVFISAKIKEKISP